MKLGKSLSLVGIFCAAVAGGMIADAVVDTGPVVCLVDPTCRSLTKNEQRMLRPLFGDTLPYSEIKVFRRPPLLKLFSDGHIASAFNNNVYLTKEAGPQQDDFGLSVDPDSGADVTGDDIFVHEVAHIWQNQRGGHSYVLEDMEYYYEIKPHSVFSDFNREQQAEIIRTYFVLKRDILRYQDKSEQTQMPSDNHRLLNKSLALQCERLQSHQKLLENVLPLEPFSTCTQPAL